MEAWARDAVEKILMMLKVFMFEVEDGPVAEPSVQPRDSEKQTSRKPKSGQGAGQNNRESAEDLGGYGEALNVHYWLGFLC